MTGATRSKDKLIGIQFGRAVAAILVVLYHGGRMLPQYLGSIGIAKLFGYGNAGVDFFFVLSGFIIFYVHSSDIDRPSRLRHYLFQRVTRIYPIYWVVTALGIAIFAAKGDWADLAPMHVFNSILLIPENQSPVVSVAWTLCHEMAFYLVFATLIGSRPVGVMIVGIWSALVVIGIFTPHKEVYLNFVESPYHIEFALGALAAYLSRSRPSRSSPIILAVGIAAFAIVAAQFNELSITNFALGRAMYGTASALIIYGLAVWETSGGVTFPRWAAFLGAASYSVYLIHTFLLGWFGKVVAKVIHPGTAADGLYIAVAAASVLGGCILYQFAERKLQNAVRGTKRADSAPHAVSLSA